MKYVKVDYNRLEKLLHGSYLIKENPESPLKIGDQVLCVDYGPEEQLYCIAEVTEIRAGSPSFYLIRLVSWIDEYRPIDKE